MIKRKKRPCKDCGKESYIFSHGRCKVCSMKSYGGIQSTPKPIKKYTPKTQKKNKERSQERNVYFKYHIERCYKSDESGKLIGEANRSNICHLFDKSRHPSVQANLDNCIYLTLQEHTDFDVYLYSHDFKALEKNFPNSWPLACRRMKKLLPLVEEKTKFYFKIKEYLDERNVNRSV